MYANRPGMKTYQVEIGAVKAGSWCSYCENDELVGNRDNIDRVVPVSLVVEGQTVATMEVGPDCLRRHPQAIERELVGLAFGKGVIPMVKPADNFHNLVVGFTPSGKPEFAQVETVYVKGHGRVHI